MWMNEFSAVYVAAEALVGLIAVPGNILVIIVILGCTALRNRPFYVFLVAMAVADLFFVCTAIPTSLIRKFGIPLSSLTDCITLLSLILFANQNAVFIQIAIAFERFFFVHSSRVHNKLFSINRCIVVIGCTWMASSLIGALPLIGWSEENEIPLKLNPSLEESFPCNHHNDHNLEPLDKSVFGCSFLKLLDRRFLFFFLFCMILPLACCALLCLFARTSLSRLSSCPKSKHRKRRRFFRCRTPEIVSKSFEKQRKWLEKLKKMFNSNYEKLDEDISSVDTSFESLDQSPKTSNKFKKSFKVESEQDQVSGKGVSGYIILNVTNTKNFEKIIPSKNEIFLLLSNGLACKLQTKQDKDSSNHAETSFLYLDVPAAILTRSKSGSGLNIKILDQDQVKKIVGESDTVYVLGLMIFFFFLCWLPIQVLTVISSFYTDMNIPSWLFDVAILLSHSKSVISFFLYASRLQSFKKELNKLIIGKVEE